MQGVAIILEWPEREGVGGQHGDMPRTQAWQCRGQEASAVQA
jgi:hypothetical protein